MESTVVYISAIADASESALPTHLSEKVVSATPPKLGEVVDMSDERTWKVIYSEAYGSTSGESIYVAVVAPTDAVDIADPENWWPVTFKLDFPQMCFSINIAPDRHIVNYEWNCDGERTTTRIWGVVENSDGQIVRKDTDWEVDRVEAFEPQLDQSFPLFNRIYLCQTAHVSPARELVTAS